VLHFLTDEQISPVVARELLKRVPGVKITALKDWRKGAFMGTDDRVILEEAAKEALTLVSYDQKTIRALLKEWVEVDVQHGGVVFVDHKSIRPDDFGGLIRALGALWRSEKNAPWKGRVVFLKLPTS
jgi:hypothetical protein